MNTNDNRELLIERYFAKELDEAKHKEVEALITNDPEFADAVKTQAYARIAIQQEGNKLLKAQLNQMGQEMRMAKRKSRTIYYRAIAAVFLVLISSVVLVRYISDQPLQDLDGKGRIPIYERPIEAPNVPNLRGVSDDLTWNQGTDLYHSGDYQAAIDTWRDISKDSLDSELWFYLGACNIMLEEVDSAHYYLAKVESASFYYYQAQWYQALLYIKSDNKEAARPILNALKEKSKKYGNFAEDILQSIY